jgi:hypothetical protein
MIIDIAEMQGRCDIILAHATRILPTSHSPCIPILAAEPTAGIRQSSAGWRQAVIGKTNLPSEAPYAPDRVRPL